MALGTLDFDPNEYQEKPVWGIWDGGRFTTYNGRGPALNGFSSYYGTLWELTADGWVERARRDPTAMPQGCERCGNVFDPSRSFSSHRNSWCWKRIAGKITKTLEQRYLCRPCDRLENY